MLGYNHAMARDGRPNDVASFEASIAKGFDGFETGFVEAGGADIAYRVGGSGPAVLLVHGWPMTGYEWHLVAQVLVRNHRVVVPDYRGAGSSSVPDSGYDNATMARDLLPLLDQLSIERAHVVGHDIGMQIAVALALVAPERVATLTVIESVVPGMSAHQAFVASGKAWHFGFNAAADVAANLVSGRERLFFEHFYDQFCARPERVPEEDRAYYADCFSSRERLRAGFRIYEAFGESAAFFADAMPENGVAMPAFVLCGEASVGDAVPAVARDIGGDRQKVLPSVGHFVPEEAPDELVTELLAFWSETAL